MLSCLKRNALLQINMYSSLYLVRAKEGWSNLSPPPFKPLEMTDYTTFTKKLYRYII